MKRKVASQLSEAALQALIVAAGLGTRLRDIAPSKPLALVCGVPLIQSVIESAAEAGISEFVVVTGYEAVAVETFLRKLRRRTGLQISTIRNEGWTLSNGLSVVAAEPSLAEEYVLLMADHLFEPALLSDLLCGQTVGHGVVLAVDRRLDNPLVDLQDVTRIETDANNNIRRVGKGITPYNAFDTGIFRASHSLIHAIRRDLASGGHGSISSGMSRLAASGLATTVDIGERFWLDVDDTIALRHAERLRA